MSFVERKISATFHLGRGSFGENGSDTVKLEGYRCQAVVQRAGLPEMSSATIRIFGLSQSIMNQLSTLGGNPKLNGRLNQIHISAGDAKIGMTEIFQGIIQNGYQDYNTMPEVAFAAECYAGGYDLVKPSDVTSYKGDVNAADILKALAARMTPPLAFENYGVNVMLASPYLPGTLIDQIREVAETANINAEVHGGTLYAWPRNGKRPGATTLISPSTGLVGYPTFNGVEIIGLTSLFQPTLNFGTQITVQSSLQPACGDWYVSSIEHDLESQMPNGAWFSRIGATSLAYFVGQPSN